MNPEIKFISKVMDSHHLQKTWTNGLSSKHGKSFLIPQISQELMSLRQPRKE